MPSSDPRTRTIAQFPADPTTASGLTVERNRDALLIRFPWRSFESVAIAALALGWVIAAVAVVTVAPITIAFPIAVAASPVALLLAWVAAAALLNRTTLRAESGLLSVRHGPIPWPQPRPIPRDQIHRVHIDLYHVGPRWGPISRVRISAKDRPTIAVTGFLIGRYFRWAKRIAAEIERHLALPHPSAPPTCPECGYDLRATPHRCPECGVRQR